MKFKGIAIPFIIIAAMVVIGLPIALVVGLKGGTGNDSNDAAEPTGTAVLANPGDRGDDSTAAGIPGTEVLIVDFEFRPSTLETKSGATVTFRNTSQTTHTVAFDGGPASDPLGAGKTFTWTAPGPGTYHYRCTIHPNLMTGEVIVQ